MAQVLVVGAGPAGATLAHVLAHRGIEVTLLERQRDFDREFRGEMLMPSGIEALEQMGLGESLDAVPHFTQESLKVYLNGKSLLEAEASDEAFRGRPPKAVSQTHLLEMIVTEAAKSPHFKLVRGASVKDLEIEKNRIVGVRARTEDGDETFGADLVIGADGRASAVRKHGGFTARGVDQPMDVVWCKIPCPDGWRGMRVYSGRGHLLIGYPSWDRNLQVAWVILKGTFGDLRSRGIEEWVAEMANHVDEEFAEHLRSSLKVIQKPFLLDVVSDRVDRWSVPGALVIGDAAHTMSPVGGQGINIALRDAIVAANHLVPVLSQPIAPSPRLDAALFEIERERVEEIVPLQRLQSLGPRIMLNRNWWGDPLRRILGTLLSFPFIQSRIGANATAFPFGITEVKLEV